MSVCICVYALCVQLCACVYVWGGVIGMLVSRSVCVHTRMFLNVCAEATEEGPS